MNLIYCGIMYLTMDKKSSRYIFFTNIPTPYRTAFYNELEKYHEFDFLVVYMREIEADRSWLIDRSNLKHKYIIDRGYYKMFGRYHLHINPRLIMMLFKLKDTSEIIVGGAWNDFNVLILVLLKRLGLFRHRLHYWSEANYLTLGASNDNFLKKIIRKFVYNCTSGTQLSSGHMTEITLRRWEIKVNKFIPLPNTIDEELFCITEEDAKLRLNNQYPVFLIPARIHEIVKGIKNFFDAIGEDNVRRCRFIVAGDGPDKHDLEKYVVDKNYSMHIELVGHCDGDQMVELYRQANAFVLGSYTDASPLTVVEALKMRLPLLLSNRCGNHFEACDEGINGYLFNPYDWTSIRNAFELLMQRRLEWEDMGRYSYDRYQNHFKMSTVISKFVSEMTTFCSSK